jgi:hypothetical protein
MNSFRVSNKIIEQVAQKQNARITAIDQIQNQSSKMTNPAQLRALAQSIDMKKDEIARLSDEQLPASIRQQLSAVKSQIEKEAAIARQNQLHKLWQNCVRMILAQLLLAFTSILIWSKFGRLGKLDMTPYRI